MLEAGAVPESSSCTPAGQPLCGAEWLLVLLPFLLQPSLGDTWPLCMLGHMLSTVLTAPYTEMLTLARLQETLH